MPVTPTREQSMAALAKANEKRFARARLRRAVRTGEVSIADVIFDPPDTLRTRGRMMPLEQLVTWRPGVGPMRAKEILRAVGISQFSTAGQITADRKRALIRKLP